MPHPLQGFLEGTHKNIAKEQSETAIKGDRKTRGTLRKAEDGAGEVFLGLFFGCFSFLLTEFCIKQFNKEASMGACLVVNNLKDTEKSTLPSPTPLRAEIEAQLMEKSIPAFSSRGSRQRSREGSGATIKSKSIIKNESKSQVGLKALESSHSIGAVEPMDSGSRAVKQVVINHERLPVQLAELSERRQVHEEQDQGEEEGECSDRSEERDQSQVETPANRVDEPEGDMVGRGLTDTDNRMIALTLSAKEPMRLNAVKLINGSIYNGEWVCGKRHGKGVLTWEDGSRYEGEWRDNFSWGQGHLTFSEHEYYEGEFVHNCREGHGKHVCFGVTYEGEWRADKRQGKGVERWGNGEHYDGEWVAGCKHGNGLLEFEDGSYYRGEFSGNEIHGQGLYFWKNSRTYEGSWEHNRMCGEGVLTWNNGQRYEGHFKNDKMHGPGVFTLPDRSSSSGIFQNGKKHGGFTETEPDGTIRQVEYYMGKKMKGDDSHAKVRNQSYDSKTLSSATHSF